MHTLQERHALAVPLHGSGFDESQGILELDVEVRLLFLHFCCPQPPQPLQKQGRRHVENRKSRQMVEIGFRTCKLWAESLNEGLVATVQSDGLRFS